MNLQRIGAAAFAAAALAAAGVVAYAVSPRENAAEGPSEPAPRAASPVASATQRVRSAQRVEITPQEREALGIQTRSVESSSRPGLVHMSATTALNPDALAHVHSRFGGEVTQVSVVLGQRVHKGDVLAINWSKDLGEKKSEYIDARSQMKLNADVLQRLEEPYRKGVIPERTHLQAVRDVEASRVAFNRASRTLISWRLSKEEISAIEREPDTEWPKETIRAPIDGVIVEKNIVPGELIDPTVNLVVISDLSKISIWAYAFEEDLGKLQADQPWEVTLKAVPGKKYKGKISVVGAVVDPNQHTVLVQGTIPNPNERLRGGMFASATVEVPAESNQVTVPTSALIDLDDRTIVYVESPKQLNQFIRRQVRVRDRLQGDAILSGGVQPGDSIVVRGALELHQKARLEAEGKTD